MYLDLDAVTTGLGFRMLFVARESSGRGCSRRLFGEFMVLAWCRYANLFSSGSPSTRRSRGAPQSCFGDVMPRAVLSRLKLTCSRRPKDTLFVLSIFSILAPTLSACRGGVDGGSVDNAG